MGRVKLKPSLGRNPGTGYNSRMAEQRILAVLIVLAGITFVVFAKAFVAYDRREPYVDPPSPLKVRVMTIVLRIIGTAVIGAGLTWLVRSFV